MTTAQLQAAVHSMMVRLVNEGWPQREALFDSLAAYGASLETVILADGEVVRQVAFTGYQDAPKEPPHRWGWLGGA